MMQHNQQRHRRKSTVRRAPIESGENPCAPLPAYKMPSIVTNQSDQVKRTRHQARSSDVAQPPSSHRSTITAEQLQHTLHHTLPPIRTRHTTAAGPAPLEHWHYTHPTSPPTARETPATQRSTLLQPMGRQGSTHDSMSVPDDVFWAAIDRLGGRDAVFARLVADKDQRRESVTAASQLPPMLSMESSQQQQQQAQAGRHSVGGGRHGNAAPAEPDVQLLTRGGGAYASRVPDGHSSGGEESMEMYADERPQAAPGGDATAMLATMGRPLAAGTRGNYLGPHDAGIRKRTSLPTNIRDSKRHYVHDATCFNCGSVPQTPQMRRGPCGERTLCNACGSKLLKGTYMLSTAQAYPSLYPINHSQRLIYWPGKQTRAEELAIHADLVHTVMDLLNQGYRFQYEKQDAANQTLLRLQDFISRHGKPPRHRGAVLDPPPPPPMEQDSLGPAGGFGQPGVQWQGGAPSGSMQGLSGSMQGLSGSMQGLSGSTQGLSGSMQGLSGSMQGLSGSMQGLSGSMQAPSTSYKQASSPAKMVHLQAWAGMVPPTAGNDSTMHNLALLSATVAAENLHQQE